MRANIITVALISLAAFQAALAAEDTFELDTITANANRILANGNYAQSAVSTIGLSDLDTGKSRDISDALLSYPGVASFRRTHATSAHPTTQGVRLRNFGSNASSRTLVLYNGVPQNDPFGGWIYWHQYDLSRLEKLSIHPSGIAETWGNMSSGGLVSMIAREAAPGARYIHASIGTSDRYELRAYAAEAITTDVVLDFGIRRFDSDGFYTLLDRQRGTVDETANSNATTINSRLSWNSGDHWKSQLSLRLLDESRSNGTAFAQNSTEALDLSLISERSIDSQNAKLNLSLYLQDREFKNVFASVAADRNSERPALDQYDMPARSIGGAAVYRKDHSPNFSYSAGLDFRLIEGSVNERYRNLGAGFTRDRNAGGEQEFIGLFTQFNSNLSESDSITLTTRLETVSQSAGSRIETNTETNAIIRNDAYTDRRNTILSGNLNWKRALSNTSSSQLTLFSGYRAPTLNELYRPFRVRNDITEANPNLANERHQGIELSLSNNLNDSSEVRLSAFYYQAEEMIANALITTASGFDPRFGFIPTGGSGSSRVNLEENRVSGIEIHANKNISETVRTSITAIYADTRILTDELIGLQGNAFPHSAPWKAVATIDWLPSEKWAFWTTYRWYDRSWENLSNSRRLGATSDLSIGARYEIDAQTSLSFSLSNALEEENITGLATNGLVTIDEPRELLLTFTWKK